MRSIAKLAMVATFIILCTYTQFTEAQPRPKGRLVLKLNSNLRPTNQPMRLEAPDNPCCVKRPLCCAFRGKVFVDNIGGINNINDLGILFDLKSSSGIVLEGASIEIYSKDNNLVFSTATKCDGCGKNLSSKTIGSSGRVLFVLDSMAASAAQPHFVKGNRLVVIFSTTGMSMPGTYYLVNKSGG